MATRVRLQLCDPRPAAGDALVAARGVARVEAACTRFDPQSPLMRANADPAAWHAVPEECYLAVAEAARAHRDTGDCSIRGFSTPSLPSVMTGPCRSAPESP